MSAAFCSFLGTSPAAVRSLSARRLLCSRPPRRPLAAPNAPRAAMDGAVELISPAEANARKSAPRDGGWVHVDVRSEGEYEQGHPPATTNIPFLRFGALGAPSPNPDFVTTVAEKFDKAQPIILSCQAGRRSAMAAEALAQAGFHSLADVEGGFAAWTQDSSLPVEK